MTIRWRTYTKFTLRLVLPGLLCYAFLKNLNSDLTRQHPPPRMTFDPSRQEEQSSKSTSHTADDGTTSTDYVQLAEYPDQSPKYIWAEPQDNTETLRASNREWPSTELAHGPYIPIPYVSPGPYHVEYPHEYHFLLDEPEKCREENPFLVLMVPVAPFNRQARDAIRSTWGSERQVLGKEVRLFFLLGLPKGEGAENLQEKVLEEGREHQDLLQSDFIDCYKNLTIKTMVMMEWLSSRCPNASYAMKIDSDMFLNVHTLVDMLLLYAPDYNYMTGQVAFQAEVLRNSTSKWYLPWEAFPEPVYPPYVLGLGYVFSMDLSRKLVEASRHVKAIYIEDVYLGLCMRQLGIEPSIPPSENLFQGHVWAEDHCHYMAVITTILYTPEQLLGVWRDLYKTEPVCNQNSSTTNDKLEHWDIN